MSTSPDTSNKDQSEIEATKKNWISNANNQHLHLYGNISGTLEKSCRELKGAFINAILEYDLEDDKSIKEMWPKLNKQRGINFIIEDTDSMIDLLKHITSPKVDDDQFFEYLHDCITKYSQQMANKGEDDLILNKTILISKLYLLLQYSINLLQTIENDSQDSGIGSRISGPLWVAGGIENFKQKRKNLIEKLKGKRQEYVPDKRLWDLALEKILYSKMVSFRGLGGYGKTTLARELVIHLIAENTQRFFDEYHLISFKTKEQGDFDVDDGQKVDPTHNMETEHPTYDGVINNLFVKLSKKIDPDSQDSSLEYKESVVIDKIATNSCLVVLDNFEDIEADDKKKTDFQMFISFFRRLKEALRERGQTTSCILITSRTDPDKEATEIFESVDLGGENRIDLGTSKEILKSYLRFKRTYDSSITSEKLQRALGNIDKITYTCSKCNSKFDSESEGLMHISNLHTKIENRFVKGGGGAREEIASANAVLNPSDSNWKELTDQGPDEKTRPEISNDILRYPIVINFIASEMLITDKAPKEIVSDFISDLSSEKGDEENRKGAALVEYVVSRSYDLRLNELEKNLTEELLNQYLKNNKLELSTIVSTLRDGDNYDLLTKLRDLKFLEPVGVTQEGYDPKEYIFPPLIAGYIRRNSTREIDDTTEDITAELKMKAELLEDSKSDDYVELIDNLILFIENNSLPLLSEIGAANLLRNTQDKILKESSQTRQQWLILNEHIESNINFDFGTDKNTRFTAAEIITKDSEQLKLTDYDCTMLSLLEQIGFEVKDALIIKIIEEYYLRKQSKTFPCENIANGDIIAFDEDTKPELIYKSNVTLFRIKSDNDEVIFSISGDDVDIQDVCKGQIIVLGKDGLAYRIKQIEAQEQETTLKMEKPDAVVELILENDIITSRYEAGFIALPNVNRLLRKNISLEDLKEILESDDRFIIDSERPFWLAKRIPESDDWKPVATSCGLPTDIICYLYVIKMIEEKIRNGDGILRLDYDRDFVNPCVRYIKSEGVTDINTTKLKRILEFMKERTTSERVLVYNSAQNPKGFINEAKSRLRLRIRRELGKAKNTRVHQPYIEDLFDEIERESDKLSTKFSSNIKDYNSILTKNKQNSNVKKSEGSAPSQDGADPAFVLNNEDKIRPFIESLAEEDFVNKSVGDLKKGIIQKVVNHYKGVSKNAVKTKVISKASLGSNNDIVKNRAQFKRYLMQILDINEFWQLISENSIIASLDKAGTAELLEKYLK